MRERTSKQIAGRIVGLNVEQQAVNIRPYKGHLSAGIAVEPIWVYANNSLFRDLVQIAESARVNSQPSVEGRFYVQGRVLLHFELSSWPDITLTLGAIKVSPEDCRSVRDLFVTLIRCVEQGYPK